MKTVFDKCNEIWEKVSYIIINELIENLHIKKNI